MSTYLSGAHGVRLSLPGLGHEWLHLVPGVVAGVVVRPHHGLDDLALVGHLGKDLGLLGLHAGGLHGREDLGLLPLGDAAEADGCKGKSDA